MAADEPKQARTVSSPEAYGYPLLLKHVLATAVREAPSQEVVYRDRVRFDYATLAQRVARLANVLSGMGLGPGSVVGVLDWDSNRYLEAYFAVPGIGAALHTVNTRLTPEQLLYTINHAADDVLLVHADFVPLVEAVWDRLETVKAVVVLTEGEAPPATSLPVHGEYEALLAGAASRFDFPDFDEHTVATTFYTTGTTGLPKGVYFSHRQLVLHTLAATAGLAAAPEQGRLHRGDVYMPITPLFHVHGWGVPFVATLLGIKQVYPGRYEPEMLLRLITHEGVTFSHCVPTVLHMLLQATEGRGIDLSRLKLVIGGSALAPGLARRALERGIDVFAGYGMSETCPVLTLGQVRPAGEADEVAQRISAGRPLPLVELRIEPLDGDGGDTGEIVVRAPWLTQGYLGDEQASRELWRGGWLHTGDIGTIGTDGCLHVTDRAKDVIKCGGEWISSLELEAQISTLPGVAEVAAIAVPDGKWGERPCALVVPGEGAAGGLDEKAVVAHLKAEADRGAIPRNAILTKVLLVEHLPKTTVGKLDKKLLRETYGA